MWSFIIDIFVIQYLLMTKEHVWYTMTTQCLWQAQKLWQAQSLFVSHMKINSCVGEKDAFNFIMKISDEIFLGGECKFCTPFVQLCICIIITYVFLIIEMLIFHKQKHNYNVTRNYALGIFVNFYIFLLTSFRTSY